MRVIGTRGRAAGELTFPQGVALAPRGLYVADGACRVQLLDHEMRFVAEIGAGGALDHACGVAVAADGRDLDSARADRQNSEMHI